MTATELEKEIAEKQEQLYKLQHELREKRIEESISEKGDIFKDKWIRIGKLLFYSKGCISDTKAFDTREFIERDSQNYFMFEFIGFEIKFTITGVHFDGYDETGTKEHDKSTALPIIRFKIGQSDIRNYKFQIIDKDDIESITDIANELFPLQLYSEDYFRCDAENKICKFTINPNVKIEIKKS